MQSPKKPYPSSAVRLRKQSQIARPEQAARMLSISVRHLYRLSREPDFPKKIILSPRAVGWRTTDLEAWIDTKLEVHRDS